MPEGPSIVILKEEVQHFAGRPVLSVSGNSKIDMERLRGKTIREFRSWGKHFLICYDDFFVRIHLLLFGSYRVNEKKENAKPRLSFQFDEGELNFYNCSVRINEGRAKDMYDWSFDTMSDEWDEAKVLKAVKANPEKMSCDMIMDQAVFAGAGNIVKNEVLFRIRVHPEALIGDLPPRKRKELVQEVRTYCLQFYEWKKRYELKKHWEIMRNWGLCPRCDLQVIVRPTGKGERKSFFCTNCQLFYIDQKAMKKPEKKVMKEKTAKKTGTKKIATKKPLTKKAAPKRKSAGKNN